MDTVLFCEGSYKGIDGCLNWHHISISTLAKTIGMSVTQTSRVVYGKRKATDSMRRKINQALAAWGLKVKEMSYDEYMDLCSRSLCR